MAMCLCTTGPRSRLACAAYARRARCVAPAQCASIPGFFQAFLRPFPQLTASCARSLLYSALWSCLHCSPLARTRYARTLRTSHTYIHPSHVLIACCLLQALITQHDIRTHNHGYCYYIFVGPHQCGPPPTRQQGDGSRH